ncbi:MAG: hypothetical protein JW913_01150 [Chitinispirillaceae bacterium]|nr:hypothetical protein [Chitinispirillaceae bacterium]
MEPTFPPHGKNDSPLTKISRCIISNGRVALFFLFPAVACPLDSADTASTIIYRFTGVNLSGPDAQLLTTKLKNMLEQVNGGSYLNAAEWEDSAKALPAECATRATADSVTKIAGAQKVVWGTIGKINDTYMCSVYRLTAAPPGNRYEVFQEEITGDLSDVLKYSIHNIAMKMTGQPDKVIMKPLPQPVPQPSELKIPPPAAAAAGKGRGRLSIQIDDDDAKLYLDGKPISSGDIELRVPAGMHRITAKNDDNTKTEFVEVFNNEQSMISLSLDENKRNVRFFMGFDASWMVGSGIEFGPSHTVGLEIKKKHLIALDYYWGFHFFDSEIFGGGINYMFTFNVKDIFLARLGGGMGFWYEQGWDYNDYYEDYYGSYYNEYFWDAFYFGGPKVRLEVGYKYVFFTVLDAQCLIGPEDVKVMLNSGISFRL